MLAGDGFRLMTHQLLALFAVLFGLQIRYLVVWNPLILLGLHFALHLVGLEKPATALAPAPAVAAPIAALGAGSDVLVNLTAVSQQQLSQA